MKTSNFAASNFNLKTINLNILIKAMVDKTLPSGTEQNQL